MFKVSFSKRYVGPTLEGMVDHGHFKAFATKEEAESFAKSVVSKVRSDSDYKLAYVAFNATVVDETNKWN